MSPLPGMSEKEFMRTLVGDRRRPGMIHMLGGLCTHFRPGYSAKGMVTPIEGDAGFPDTCIVTKSNRLLFRELKVGRNRLRPEQQMWLERLQAAGADAKVWTDQDLASGLIERELMAPP
ncbi:MAG: VRR-NUC domain-containing protein [Acidimicrobiaceae bacterium]|nr:VRR-NUC domain-containing protein [Acidimicrobiaceae bacterium]